MQYSVIPQLVGYYDTPHPMNTDHSQAFPKHPVYFSMGTICGGESVPVCGTFCHLVMLGLGHGLAMAWDASMQTIEWVLRIFSPKLMATLSSLVLVTPSIK